MENVIKHTVEKDPESIAFLLLEKPIKDHHVVDPKEKQKLEDIVKGISRKLSMIELLGYTVEFTINSHKTFTLKIARKDRDLDRVIYLKMWDPRYKAKIVMLGGWVVINNKWVWGQYIAVDLSYNKDVDPKQLFDLVKKLIQLVV